MWFGFEDLRGGGRRKVLFFIAPRLIHIAKSLYHRNHHSALPCVFMNHEIMRRYRVGVSRGGTGRFFDRDRGWRVRGQLVRIALAVSP